MIATRNHHPGIRDEPLANVDSRLHDRKLPRPELDNDTLPH
jgi:hypothetical protein